MRINISLCVMISFLTIVSCSRLRTEGEIKRTEGEPAVVTPETKLPDRLSAYDAEVSCLHKADKAPTVLRHLWHTESLSNQIKPAPVIDQNALYLNLGGFVCIDLETGKLQWRYSGREAGGSNIKSSPRLINGKLVAGTNSYAVISIDPLTGEDIWIYRTGGWVSAPIQTDLEQAKVFVGAWDKKFHALDLCTGQRLWTFPVQSRIGSEACVQDDYVYFSDAGTLVCLEKETGELVSKISLPKLPVSGPISSGDGSMLVWCSDGFLYEVLLQTKDPGFMELVRHRRLRIAGERRFVQEGFPHCRHLWFGSNLVLLSDDGQIACINVSKWEIVWNLDNLVLRSRPFDLCAYRNEQMLISSNEGWVTALRVNDGKALWEANLPGIYSPQIVYSNHRLYAVGVRDGVVSAYMLQ
ncbi:MAG: PQQ-like beta-propeller repeat protein [Planctomycetes bacterium]|nr:PQQ-like beta-propeller repeat protein [Planctomycetota bacterium]